MAHVMFLGKKQSKKKLFWEEVFTNAFKLCVVSNAVQKNRVKYTDATVQFFVILFLGIIQSIELWTLNKLS